MDNTRKSPKRVRRILTVAAAAGLVTATAAPALAAPGPAGSLGSLAPSPEPAVLDTLQVGDGNYEVAVDALHNRAYLASPGAKAVTVLDATTNATLKTIELEHAPYGVAVNPVTQRVYTSDTRDEAVTVIDADDLSVIGSIATGKGHGIEVDPVRDLVYLAVPGDSAVQVIDGTTDGVVATVPTGETPVQVAVDAARGSYWVATTGDATVTEYSSATNERIGAVPTAEGPQNMYLDTVRGKLYVDAFKAGKVDVVDVNTDSVVESIDVGAQPIGIDCNPVSAVCVVPHLTAKGDGGKGSTDPDDPGRVSVINADAGTKIAELHIGGVPLGVGYNPLTSTALVTDRGSADVAVIGA